MLSIPVILISLIVIFAVFFYVEHLVLTGHYKRSAKAVQDRALNSHHFTQYALDLNPDWKNVK